MNDPAAPNTMARWVPAGAAIGLVAAVLGVGLVSGVGSSAADPTTTFVVPESSVAPQVVETVTPEAQVRTESTEAPVVKEPIDRTLTDGLSGDDVEMVQTRLADLRFDPGPIDGIYGSLTRQAVWAFEKLVLDVPRAQATGRVTPEMWDRMQEPIVVAPRRPTGGLANHVEIYLQEQVMVIFHADEPQMIAHVSSGELDENGNPVYFTDEAVWDVDPNGNPYEEPRTGTASAYAKTPGGVFTADRMVEGKRTGPLGGMWNPVYFNYGIAVHGAENVPLQPASHGCIRVNKPLGEQLQTLIALGDRILVWGHDGKAPEDFTDEESLPSFNSREYDTTTTTSTTTLPPATTLPPVTTTPPPATTAPPPPPPTAAPTTAPPPPPTAAPTTAAPTTTTSPPPPPPPPSERSGSTVPVSVPAEEGDDTTAADSD